MPDFFRRIRPSSQTPKDDWHAVVAPPCEPIASPRASSVGGNHAGRRPRPGREYRSATTFHGVAVSSPKKPRSPRRNILACAARRGARHACGSAAACARGIRTYSASAELHQEDECHARQADPDNAALISSSAPSASPRRISTGAISTVGIHKERTYDQTALTDVPVATAELAMTDKRYLDPRRMSFGPEFCGRESRTPQLATDVPAERFGLAKVNAWFDSVDKFAGGNGSVTRQDILSAVSKEQALFNMFCARHLGDVKDVLSSRRAGPRRVALSRALRALGRVEKEVSLRLSKSFDQNQEFLGLTRDDIILYFETQGLLMEYSAYPQLNLCRRPISLSEDSTQGAVVDVVE